MPHEEPPASFVRFVPSAVKGIAGVDEVAIGPDRLMLRIGDAWQAHAFAEMKDRVRWLTGATSWSGKSGRVVGDLRFDREVYTRATLRFATVPPIEIAMPHGRPTEYPHSDFWLATKMVQSGGFHFFDRAIGAGIEGSESVRPPTRVQLAVRRVLGPLAMLSIACFLFTILANFPTSRLLSWFEFPMSHMSVACRDSSGRIYVGHPMLGRIQRYTPNGEFEFSFRGASGGPEFYIADDGTLRTNPLKRTHTQDTYSPDGDFIRSIQLAPPGARDRIELHASWELVPHIRDDNGRVLVRNRWWLLPIASPLYAMACVMVVVVLGMVLDPAPQRVKRIVA
jgi:hypothetical protein